MSGSQPNRIEITHAERHMQIPHCSAIFHHTEKHDQWYASSIMLPTSSTLSALYASTMHRSHLAVLLTSGQLQHAAGLLVRQVHLLLSHLVTPHGEHGLEELHVLDDGPVGEAHLVAEVAQVVPVAPHLVPQLGVADGGHGCKLELRSAVLREAMGEVTQVGRDLTQGGEGEGGEGEGVGGGVREQVPSEAE